MVKDNGIELFLDDLASRKPTPSGGSAAAVMGAMGAALVSMVCNLTIGKTQYRDFEEELKAVLTKAEELRARELASQLGLNIKQVARAVATIMSAYRAFRDCDATMLEINPLVLTKDDRIVALDAKMSFDDRHCSDGTT